MNQDSGTFRPLADGFAGNTCFIPSEISIIRSIIMQHASSTSSLLLSVKALESWLTPLIARRVHRLQGLFVLAHRSATQIYQLARESVQCKRGLVDRLTPPSGHRSVWPADPEPRAPGTGPWALPQTPKTCRPPPRQGVGPPAPRTPPHVTGQLGRLVTAGLQQLPGLRYASASHPRQTTLSSRGLKPSTAASRRLVTARRGAARRGAP